MAGAFASDRARAGSVNRGTTGDSLSGHYKALAAAGTPLTRLRSFLAAGSTEVVSLGVDRIGARVTSVCTCGVAEASIEFLDTTTPRGQLFGRADKILASEDSRVGVGCDLVGSLIPRGAGTQPFSVRNLATRWALIPLRPCQRDRYQFSCCDRRSVMARFDGIDNVIQKHLPELKKTCELTVRPRLTAHNQSAAMRGYRPPLNLMMSCRTIPSVPLPRS